MPVWLDPVGGSSGRRRPTRPASTVTPPLAPQPAATTGPVAPTYLDPFESFLATLGTGPVYPEVAPFARRPDEQIGRIADEQVGDAINPTLEALRRERGHVRFGFDVASEKAKGLSEAFLQILTGGKTGDEAMAHSKEQFGGSYLPAQAMQLGAQMLQAITHDFAEEDWRIASHIADVIAKRPQLRQQIMADVLAEEGRREEAYYNSAEGLYDRAEKDYDRRVKVASVILDEHRRQQGELAERGKRDWERHKFETTEARQRTLVEQRERALIANQMLAGQKTAQQAARDLSNLTGHIHVVDRKGNVVDTGKLTATEANRRRDDKRAAAASARAADGQPGVSAAMSDQLGYAADARGNPILDPSGNQIPWDPNKGKRGGTGSKPTASEKRAELGRANTAVRSVLKSHRAKSGQTITTKSGSTITLGGDKSKGKYDAPYDAIYDEVFAQVYDGLRLAGFTDGYIDRWIRKQLTAAGLKRPTAPTRRSGR